MDDNGNGGVLFFIFLCVSFVALLLFFWYVNALDQKTLIVGLIGLSMIVAFVIFLVILEFSARKDLLRKEKRRLDLESRITSLKQKISKNEVAYNQIKEFEQELDNLISSNREDLSIKADKLKNYVKILSLQKIIEEEDHLHGKIAQIREKKIVIEKQLNYLQNKQQKNEQNIENIKLRLNSLRKQDPANIQIQLEILYRKWNNLKQNDLEAVQTKGSIAKIVKEELLCIYHSKNLKNEINNLKREIETLNHHECKLRINEIILQKRRIELKEPDVLKIDGIKRELVRLEDNFNREFK